MEMGPSIPRMASVSQIQITRRSQHPTDTFTTEPHSVLIYLIRLALRTRTKSNASSSTYFALGRCIRRKVWSWPWEERRPRCTGMKDNGHQLPFLVRLPLACRFGRFVSCFYIPFSLIISTPRSANTFRSTQSNPSLCASSSQTIPMGLQLYPNKRLETLPCATGSRNCKRRSSTSSRKTSNRGTPMIIFPTYGRKKTDPAW